MDLKPVGFIHLPREAGLRPPPANTHAVLLCGPVAGGKGGGEGANGSAQPLHSRSSYSHRDTDKTQSYKLWLVPWTYKEGLR